MIFKIYLIIKKKKIKNYKFYLPLTEIPVLISSLRKEMFPLFAASILLLNYKFKLKINLSINILSKYNV